MSGERESSSNTTRLKNPIKIWLSQTKSFTNISAHPSIDLAITKIISTTRALWIGHLGLDCGTKKPPARDATINHPPFPFSFCLNSASDLRASRTVTAPLHFLVLILFRTPSVSHQKRPAVPEAPPEPKLNIPSTNRPAAVDISCSGSRETISSEARARPMVLRPSVISDMLSLHAWLAMLCIGGRGLEGRGEHKGIWRKRMRWRRNTIDARMRSTTTTTSYGGVGTSVPMRR